MAAEHAELDETIDLAATGEYDNMLYAVPDVVNGAEDHANELLLVDDAAALPKKRTPEQEALLAEMRERETILLKLVTAYGEHPFVQKTIFEWRTPGEALFSNNITKDILSEIAHYPLLTHEEERLLLQWLDDAVSLYKLLPNQALNTITPDQEAFFVKAVTAHQILQLANMRLVVHMVRKYIGVSDLELVDLISEGNIGLAKGVRRLLLRLGNRLSTVATQWIRQNTGRKIAETGYVITLPPDLRTAVNAYIRQRYQLRKDLGREPTDADIAKAWRKNIEYVKRVGQLCGRIAFSLDELVDRKDSSSAARGDFIQANTRPSNGEAPEAANRLAWLQICMQELTPREREALALCYGMDDDISRTPAEAAEELGLSTDRIRKLRTAAIGKIAQHPSADAYIRERSA